jgi:dihydrofolate reductase
MAHVVGDWCSALLDTNKEERCEMRNVVVEAEVSLDCLSGGENPEFWMKVFQFHSDDVVEYLNDLLAMPDALVMGRKTYEGFAQIWPSREGREAERINPMPKYVASRSLQEPLTWNATLIKGDVAGAIGKLKQQSDGYLLQYGVGELTRTMLDAGLVDELRLVVFPFIAGQGDRLFEGCDLTDLKLVETRTFTSGAVALHYQPSRR